MAPCWLAVVCVDDRAVVPLVDAAGAGAVAAAVDAFVLDLVVRVTVEANGIVPVVCLNVEHFLSGFNCRHSLVNSCMLE